MGVERTPNAGDDQERPLASVPSAASSQSHTDLEAASNEVAAEESPEADAHAAPALSDNFPLDSLRAAAIHFRRPFTDAAVKWKVQAVWPKGDPHSGLVVPYIDARLVVERLNAIAPHLWEEEYAPVAGGKGLLCELTVDGVTRRDVGSGYEGKGLYSDALKRAAVKFGIGVSLYALPKIVLKKADGLLETKEIYDPKTGGKKKTLALTEKGTERCQGGYRKWLEDFGEAAFGPTLDHGDVFGSYGDVEADAPVADAAAEPAPEAPAKLEDERAKDLISRAEELHGQVPPKDMPRAAFVRQLESAWHSHDELEKLVKALDAMVTEQAGG